MKNGVTIKNVVVVVVVGQYDGIRIFIRVYFSIDTYKAHAI